MIIKVAVADHESYWLEVDTPPPGSAGTIRTVVATHDAHEPDRHMAEVLADDLGVGLRISHSEEAV